MVLCKAASNGLFAAAGVVLRGVGALRGGYDGLGVTVGKSLRETKASEIEGLEDHLGSGTTFQDGRARLGQGASARAEGQWVSE